MNFIENVVARRVFIYPPATKKLSMEPQRNINTRQTNSHRVVVVLEEFARGIESLRVHSEATEEENEILIAHACLDQLKCTLL